MLNINNLNRARKILSAQQGIKASFNTPDEKIKFCGKYGPYYKYSFGNVGTEDWNNGDVFSDLPPDKFYESEGGSAYLPPLEYADGVDPNNVEQPIYKGYGYDKKGDYYYGVTQSEEKQRLSSEDYQHLMDQKGLIDWNMKEDGEKEEEMENKMLGLKSTTSTTDKEKKQSNTAQSSIQSLTPSAIQSPAPSLEDYTKGINTQISTASSKIDTQSQNEKIAQQKEFNFYEESVNSVNRDRWDTPKKQVEKAEANKAVSQEKIAKSASLTPSDKKDNQSTSQTLQPKIPIDNPSIVTIPITEQVNTQRNPSGQGTTTEEQPKKSESFLKGEAAGKEIGEKIGNFLKSDGVQKAGEYGEKAGVIADAVDGMIRSGNDWAPQTGFENTWDQASTIAMKFGPLGEAIGGGMKVAKVVSDLFGSKTQDFAKDISTLETVGGSYGGSSALIEDAANKAGKKYGLFANGAKRSANRLIDRARIQQYAMQGIADDARDLNSMRSYMDPYYLQYQSDISGGYDQRYMHVAKLGGTLTLNNTFPVKQYIHINKDYTPNFYKSGGTLQTDTWFPIINESEFYWEPIITFETPTFKSGGTIKEPEIEVIEVDTTQKSVIPEGALHKNKHNLDQVGVDDSELTKKGIPVVDNQGDQQAEIELNEIIFTLEVTKELEKRYKEYYKEETKQSRKDELAIEAGKLLWKEIIYNTDDRTGLIDSLKKGGSIQSKNTQNSNSIAGNLLYKEDEKIYKQHSLEKDTKNEYLIPNKEYISKQDSKISKNNINDILNILKDGGSVEIIEDDIKILDSNGDYTFKISGKNNPRLNKEIDSYLLGENNLIQTHDLIYNKDLGVYQYKKRPTKHDTGGFITYTPVESLVSSNVYNEKVKTWMEDLFPNYDEIVYGTSTESSINEESKTSNESDTQSITSTQTDNLSTQIENDSNTPITKSTNTPIPTNLNLKGWDLQKTLQHLRSHAHEKSTHWCARYVRQALEAGGLVGFRVGDAKDEVQKKTLESIGFSRIAEAVDDDVTKGYIPQAGDIAITYTNGSHASMYDGTRWISDFRQNGLDVFRKRKGNKAIIYRRISGDNQNTNTENSTTSNENNVILINKTQRTLTVNGKTFKVAISKKGLDQTSKSGDGLTPEGEFSLGNRESKGGYNDPVYGWRPNAYGGRFYRLSGGVAQGRQFGIHGSDQYNDPNKYQEGKFGTNGCIALKDQDLSELEKIMEENGGPSNFKVKIIKGLHGGKFQKSRTIYYKHSNN